MRLPSLFVLHKAMADAYPFSWLVAMSWERDALQIPGISQIHIGFYQMLLANCMSTRPLHSSTLKI